ncbi:MAG TPA: hypothetical protein VJ773_10770 [Gemmatimonadales bacterium]|nr:hypothetical protein [Gemmatimonadales bacterium]
MLRRIRRGGLVLGLLLAAWSGSAGAQRTWRPEDRLVLRDYSRVVAVAAGLDRAYAVTPDAILLLDPRTRRWTGVADAPEPGALRSAGFALVDPLDNALWLASRSEWFRYQPELRLWERGLTPGAVVQAAIDRADPTAGLHLRLRGGWAVVPRIGGAALPGPAPVQPVFATTFQDAARANPTLEAFAAHTLAAGRRVPARYTSAAPAADGMGWFLGTDGLGVLWLDGVAIHPERLPFGLESDRVAALVALRGGVWTLTEPSSSGLVGGAVTWVGAEGDEFRAHLGPFGAGLDFTRGWDLVASGTALWAATDAGLLRVAADGDVVDEVNEGRGLPDARVYGLAAWHDRVYVATRGGIARVDDTLGVERLAPIFPGPAFAIAVRADTAWVGTPQGVFAAPPGAADLERAAGAAPRAESRRDVGALAWAGDTLVALTRDELLYTTGREVWMVGPRLSGSLGALRALAPWRDGFWVAGQRGVAFVTLGAPPGLVLSIPGDLPGEPTDIAAEGPYLWVATYRGLVRFRLDAVQP